MGLGACEAVDYFVLRFARCQSDVRRLSPRAAASPTVQAAKKVQPSRRNGWGKHGGAALKTLRVSQFPTATTAVDLRLYFKCLDGQSQGHILKWLHTTTSHAHTSSLLDSRRAPPDHQCRRFRFNARRKSRHCGGPRPWRHYLRFADGKWSRLRRSSSTCTVPTPAICRLPRGVGGCESVACQQHKQVQHTLQ